MPTLPDHAPLWVVLVSILVSGGLLDYVRDWLKQRRLSRSTPKPVQLAIANNAAADSSISIVARARDELAEDVDRLRAMLAEERANTGILRETLYRERQLRDEERTRWETREQRYLDRIAELERNSDLLRSQIHQLRRDIERGEG